MMRPNNNMDLISKLGKNSDIEGSWYYNCAVYGKTDAGKRMKFDIFDDIDKRLANSS